MIFSRGRSTPIHLRVYGEGAVLLRGFALDADADLLAAISEITQIVSVSLGLSAIFQFGGLQRSDPLTKYVVRHGDVAVWGGPSRLCYHGVLALKEGVHAKAGRMRLNLTFRCAL